MKKLDGRIALVTGAGRGIGRAIALKLAHEGASVVVNDLDAEPALQVVEEIRRTGARAHAVPGSVTDPAFPAVLIQAVLATYGGIDIIVNNAGFAWDGVIQKMSDEQFQAMHDIHVLAPFRILREAIGPMRERAKLEAGTDREVYRKVVNISSAVAFGSAGQVNYSSAKAAVIGLTKTLAKEWGRYRINVNAVAFGIIATRLTDTKQTLFKVGNREVAIGGVPEERKQAGLAAIPLGRAGTPEEAAGAVALLCYPESNYISGQVLLCDGALV